MRGFLWLTNWAEVVATLLYLTRHGSPLANSSPFIIHFSVAQKSQSADSMVIYGCLSILILILAINLVVSK